MTLLKIRTTVSPFESVRMHRIIPNLYIIIVEGLLHTEQLRTLAPDCLGDHCPLGEGTGCLSQPWTTAGSFVATPARHGFTLRLLKESKTLLIFAVFGAHFSSNPQEAQAVLESLRRLQIIP